MENIFNEYITFDLEKDEIIGLNNETKALYILNYLKEKKQNITVVANSLYEATHIYQSLSTYTDKVLFFPMDDFLTSEALAISPELKTTRLETISTLYTEQKHIIVTNLMGYLRYLPTYDNFKKNILFFEKGSRYSVEDITKSLLDSGYEKETIVNKTGTVAIRGFVVDIFPISSKYPVRIEFWGDEIESIRYFDVDTQLTIEEINNILIFPSTEFINYLSLPFKERFYRNFSKYFEFTNISNFLPNSIVIFDDYNMLSSSYNMLLAEMMNYSISKDFPADTTYMNDFYAIKNNQEIYLSNFDNSLSLNSISYKINDIPPFGQNPDLIREKLNEYLIKNKYVIICLSDRYKVNRVMEEIQDENAVFTNLDNIIIGKLNFIVKNIADGFVFNSLVVISEKELFNKRDTNHLYKSNFKIGTKIRDIGKLNIGDIVVHIIYGIGRYVGMKSINKDGILKDYLTIEYKDEDKLYIPVEKIDYIHKYSSNDGMTVKLSKMGGAEWSKIRHRVQSKVKDIAKDLLKLYAEREKATGFSFLEDSKEQYEFERMFPYDETLDQIRVTEEIKKDMESIRPMDRLVCGDVGYGKTEVAFRAIFKAIMSSKQVAFLCPTTILSQQHYQNALERFGSFPINIAILNRFVTASKLSKTIADIKAGKIDIVIGTHRLLSSDVEFKNLGLLVIDEEQRFGVKHKEKIKGYKNNIDIITLTATPIPRTLQLSMSGLRSLSLIETPPSNRYPVQTYVIAENNQILKDAIYKEVSRNGQVFILYNYVDNMLSKVKEIEKLVPDARVTHAHGRMSKTELENIMMKFINYEYDVCVCTTIIETGIDIPNVNTLIIIDADRFGLSQLYQIRGRVGRSNKIAYCYLMYDKGKILSEAATKRLKVIKEFTELGSGFSIAMRDLSIRGAGNILGSEQSGFIDSVGIELFMKMLDEEINKQKGLEPVSTTISDMQPLINVTTSIDDEYINNEELKIDVHKKINMIDSLEKLEEIKEELSDRFGKLPDDIIIYMYSELFEKRAKKYDIDKIIQNKNSISVYLPVSLSEKINGEKLFINLYRVSKMFRLSFKNKMIIIVLDTVKIEKHFVYYLLDMMDVIESIIK